MDAFFFKHITCSKSPRNFSVNRAGWSGGVDGKGLNPQPFCLVLYKLEAFGLFFISTILACCTVQLQPVVCIGCMFAANM